MGQFDGLIDEISFFDIPFNIKGVKTLYNDGRVWDMSRDEGDVRRDDIPGMVFYYKLNDGAGAPGSTDMSGNGYNGILTTDGVTAIPAGLGLAADS